jgi:hypothetical protein
MAGFTSLSLVSSLALSRNGFFVLFYEDDMSTPVEDLSIFVSTAIFMNAIIAVAVSGASFERGETGWERT